MSSSAAPSIPKAQRNIFSSSSSSKGNKSGTRSMQLGKSKEAEDANVKELSSNHNYASIGKSRSAEYSVDSYEDISLTRATAQRQSDLDNNNANVESFSLSSTTKSNVNNNSYDNSKGVKPPVSPRKKSASGITDVDSSSANHEKKISSTPSKKTNELLKKQINGPRSLRKWDSGEYYTSPPEERKKLTELAKKLYKSAVEDELDSRRRERKSSLSFSSEKAELYD